MLRVGAWLTREGTALLTPPIAILKTVWSRENGEWAISDLKSLELRPQPKSEGDYFAIDSRVELLTESGYLNMHQVMASFGPTDFLLKQSIVPVVAWRTGDEKIRCIGTGTLISCSGYIMTAAHVLMDPIESGYGVSKKSKDATIDDDLHFGVFIPFFHPEGARGLRYFPFEKYWVWGHWEKSLLFHEPDRFVYLTDIAICKIPEMPNGVVHQPLNLSVNPFSIGEAAYSIGYAEMDDIPVAWEGGKIRISRHPAELFVSIGKVTDLFPQNHVEKLVSAPGPCFGFKAKIPGKMSGAPVFGADGAVIRGVVSRSWSGERDATGAMLGPTLRLSLDEPGTTGRNLLSMMKSRSEGIAQVHGMGL
jgi:hypothetical protein